MATPRVSAEWKERTLDVRRAFEASGTNVSAWARERGFSPKLVAMVLRGDRPCLRGESHRIALALGLKITAKAPAPSPPTAPTRISAFGAMEPVR